MNWQIWARDLWESCRQIAHHSLTVSSASARVPVLYHPSLLVSSPWQGREEMPPWQAGEGGTGIISYGWALHVKVGWINSPLHCAPPPNSFREGS